MTNNPVVFVAVMVLAIVQVYVAIKGIRQGLDLGPALLLVSAVALIVLGCLMLLKADMKVGYRGNQPVSEASGSAQSEAPKS